MKYKNDFLELFKNELMNKIPNQNTRKNYLYEIEKAFKNQEFSNLNDFDYEKLKDYTKNLETKRSASALKCSLQLFSETFKDFNFANHKDFFRKQVAKKSSNRTTKWSQLNLKKVMKKINFISDDKKRLAYRTIIATGLRIDELANVKKKDITIKDDKIYVFVEKGKFNKQRTVTALEDQYLKNELENFLAKFDGNEKIFHSAGYMKNMATKKGFTCHDLRRAYAKALFKVCLAEDKSKNYISRKEKAINEVKKQLGHEKNSKTYKKYLSRNIDFSNTKWG